MKVKYLIPVVFAFGLIALLNFGATTVKPTDPDQDNKPTAPVIGKQDVVALNIDSFITVLKKKLPPEVQANVSLIENNISRGDIKKQKIADYEQIGQIWLDQGKKAIAAHYYGLSGKLGNSEKNLNFAGHLFSEELSDDKDIMPAMKSWVEQEAIASYSAALELNPINDSAKIALATIYMSAKEPMKGVQQLLDIVKRDSTNLAANIMLGKWDLQSTQWDKAIERGKIVLRQKPNDVNAYLFMGEAYKQKGDKAKAIQLFNEAKKIMNNSSFSKDIDAYIATF